MAWGSFTHGDGHLVSHVDLLRSPALGGLAVNRLPQYASTAFRLAVVRHLWRHRDHRLHPREGTGTAARSAPAVR
ncbi:DUF4184 family protein [Streptomyces sp. NPDC057245]|uniref:DUF4184 family protein n=1 Tax=Streptomyces sp. NPDC057245 TaxID=3346065 RepID=UPI0036382BF6